MIYFPIMKDKNHRKSFYYILRINIKIHQDKYPNIFE